VEDEEEMATVSQIASAMPEMQSALPFLAQHIF
jgi:hypothetical protein